MGKPPFISVLAGALFIAMTSTARGASGSHPAINAGRVFDYTDDAGTTHLTNLPAQSGEHLRVLVEMSVPIDEISQPRFPAPSSQLLDWIDEAARVHHVDAALIKAVMAVESGFDSNALSPKGAAGLMQLMPQTAQAYGVSDRMDAKTSIFAGAKHLRDLLDEFGGDRKLAVAAYNAGSAAVLRYHSDVPPFAETQSYVPRVLELYRRFTKASSGREAQ